MNAVMHVTIGQKIQALRKSRDLNLEDIAQIAGVSIPSVHFWESGKFKPKTQSVRKICQHFGLDFQPFIDEETDYFDNDMPKDLIGMPSTRLVPLLGDIACGDPLNPDASSAESVQMPDFIHADYALRCKGDSMINARIYDGDIVYIRQQPEVVNGEIAAVIVDDEITLKRVYRHPHYTILQPENPAHEPIILTPQHFQTGKARIIGKAVAFTSKVR